MVRNPQHGHASLPDPEGLDTGVCFMRGVLALVTHHRDNRAGREHGTEGIEQVPERRPRAWLHRLPCGEGAVWYVGDDEIHGTGFERGAEGGNVHGIGPKKVRHGWSGVNMRGEVHPETGCTGEGIRVGRLAIPRIQRGDFRHTSCHTRGGEEREIAGGEGQGIRVYVRTDHGPQSLSVQEAERGEQVAASAAWIVEHDPITAPREMRDASLEDFIREAHGKCCTPRCAQEHTPRGEISVVRALRYVIIGHGMLHEWQRRYCVGFG